MGNLIIKKVRYSGDKYSFESPELTTGINIIVGDNGSGKSTFAYFIEFGLGGFVASFNRDNKKTNNSTYTIILDDTNNYVELQITINERNYTLKRFIGDNEIRIREQEEDGIIKYPLYRNKQYAATIFSDWLLEKLDIKPFELSLGTASWTIGFNDLFRLLNYDQYSNPSNIYKDAASSNFISDSSIIRKAIFETLIGISSQEYNINFNNFKHSQIEKNNAQSIVNYFEEKNPSLNIDNLTELESELEKLELELKSLYIQRSAYQKQHTNSKAKTEHLSQIQQNFIALELQISEDVILKKEYSIEYAKIQKLLASLKDEIAQIEKIIFTHDSLNLFSLEICPFCAKEAHIEENHCICGSKIDNADYEKFVYKSSEYKIILNHKTKSLNSIVIASDSYNSEIVELEKAVKKNSNKVDSLKKELEEILNSIEFSGNSQLIDSLNDKIITIKENIFDKTKIINLLQDKKGLEANLNAKKKDYEDKKNKYEKSRKLFDKNNAETIEAFNSIYEQLITKSSCSSSNAQINDDYMPYIDHGEYKERSTVVPIRLMYYFTLLSMGLKRDSVKHPHFLLIDTPEDAGIDKDNLKLNLKLLDDALLLSKNNEHDEIKKFQVILTTGESKYPDDYAQFIKIIFNKTNNQFILKPK